MTLKEYYNSLADEEKLEFKEKILRRTRRNNVTFYRWLNDVNRPSYIEQKLIARLADLKVTEMFPERK